MAATWDHPKLGKFKFDLVAWHGVAKAPAFDVFTYDDGLGDQRKPNGKYEIAFSGEDESDTPPAPAVALALKVLDAQKELPARVMKALWDDFNGRGPYSGMWWHDDLAQVGEAMEDSGAEPPASADDLRKVLWLASIKVRKEVHRYPRPVVELSFSAAFEEEHGVGVLTDGKKILGLGYSHDVTPFKEA